MKKTLILIVALFVCVFVVVLLGNIITIGEKFTTVFGTPYIEYAFYVLIFGVFGYLVFYPMYRIHTSPEFPILAVEDKEDGVTEEKYNKRLFSFASQLCNNCYYLPATKRLAHQKFLKDNLTTLKQNYDIEGLKVFLKEEIDLRLKSVDRRIMNYSTKVFVITAISQSDRFDALTTLVMNYRMINDIIRASGFRPTTPQLVKQYCRIIVTAFLSYFISNTIDFDDVTVSLGDNAEGLTEGLDFDISDVDLGDLDLSDVDASGFDFTKFLKNFKIPGIAIDSILDGCANTIMTLRIGYVTKAYLQKGSKELKGVKGAKVRRDAMLSALKKFPTILAEAPQRMGSKTWSLITDLLTKVYKKKEEEIESEDGDIEPKPKKKGLLGIFKRG